jgi:hypothetical protein
MIGIRQANKIMPPPMIAVLTLAGGMILARFGFAEPLAGILICLPLLALYYMVPYYAVRRIAKISPYHTLREVYQSINGEVYNTIAALLLALPLRIFGTSFVCYSMAVFNFFLLPTGMSTPNYGVCSIV